MTMRSGCCSSNIGHFDLATAAFCGRGHRVFRESWRGHGRGHGDFRNCGVDMDVDTEFFKNRGVDMDMDTA